MGDVLITRHLKLKEFEKEGGRMGEEQYGGAERTDPLLTPMPDGEQL